jgi:hypothetical protein
MSPFICHVLQVTVSESTLENIELRVHLPSAQCALTGEGGGPGGSLWFLNIRRGKVFDKQISTGLRKGPGKEGK